MPKHIHGQGPYTHIKQEHYRALVSALLEIFPHIQQRNDWVSPVFHEIEMNAGCGCALDGSPGSPLIFAEEAERRGIQYRQFCLEVNEQSCLELFVSLSGVSIQTGERLIIPGDHNHTINEVMERIGPLRQAAIGLLYADPNNAEPPLDAIQRFYADPRFRYMDCAINVPATQYKRNRRAGPVRNARLRDGRQFPFFSEHIDRIPKRYKLIRVPIGRFQWMMVVGTNWAKFPVMKKYGFHRLDSPEGQNILDRVNWVKDERDEGTARIPA